MNLEEVVQVPNTDEFPYSSGVRTAMNDGRLSFQAKLPDNSVNLREGYPILEIRTPREVIDYGKD